MPITFTTQPPAPPGFLELPTALKNLRTRRPTGLTISSLYQLMHIFLPKSLTCATPLITRMWVFWIGIPNCDINDWVKGQEVSGNVFSCRQFLQKMNEMFSHNLT